MKTSKPSCRRETEYYNKTVLRYYDNRMKQVITQQDVAKAIKDLGGQGKKPTLAAIHAALNHRGSMSTLCRLKTEIEAAAQPVTDSPEAGKLFKDLWALAVDEGRKQQEAVIAELRDNLHSLATENERLDGTFAAVQNRAGELEQAKCRAEADLSQIQSWLEGQLNQAQTALVEAGAQTTTALKKLAEVQAATASQIAVLHSDLGSAVSHAHRLELELAHAQALLDTKGVVPGKA